MAHYRVNALFFNTPTPRHQIKYDVNIVLLKSTIDLPFVHSGV